MNKRYLVWRKGGVEKRWGIGWAASWIAMVALAADAGDAIYRCNYDVSIEWNGEQYSVRHQDSVRDGSHIPVSLQGSELQIQISEGAAGTVRVVVSLYEAKPLAPLGRRLTAHGFPVSLGTPTRESWADDAVAVDIALAVSRVGP